MNGQRCLRCKRPKVERVFQWVPDQRGRTTRRITKVYPDHLRILCVRSKVYRPEYERDKYVKKKRTTMICNFTMSRPLDESSRGLYCKENEYPYCSTKVNFRIVVCRPKTHRRLQPLISFH